jgi:hypothetical protein
MHENMTRRELPAVSGLSLAGARPAAALGKTGDGVLFPQLNNRGMSTPSPV